MYFPDNTAGLQITEVQSGSVTMVVAGRDQHESIWNVPVAMVQNP